MHTHVRHVLYLLTSAIHRSPVTKSPVVHPLSAQLLTKCSSHNSFVFRFMHFNGGCISPLLFYHPGSHLQGAERIPSRPHLYLLTSLPSDSLTSLLPYFSPVQSLRLIRGRNEFQPATRRSTNRLQAPLLGRQHY